MTVTGSTDVELSHAIAHLILDLETPILPEPTGGPQYVPMIPQAPLTAQVTAGAHSAFIDPTLTGRFMLGGRLFFRDGTAEEALKITDVNATTGEITLDFGGTGYSAFRFTHPVNTTVYTNLQETRLYDDTHMLERGDPVIFVSGMSGYDDADIVERSSFPILTMHIQYRRLLQKDETNPIDPNLWAERQERKARTDLNTIRQALLLNQELRDEDGDHAISLGRLQKGKLTATDWSRPSVIPATTWQFFAFMNVTVTGNADSNG